MPAPELLDAAGGLRVRAPDGNPGRPSASDEPQEPTFVDETTFWATF